MISDSEIRPGVKPHTSDLKHQLPHVFADSRPEAQITEQKLRLPTWPPKECALQALQ